MINLKDLADQLKLISHKNDYADLHIKENLCFEVLELYIQLDKACRTEEDKQECCYAAVILSGLISKNLHKKVLDFLNKHETILPQNAQIVLRANLMRMAGF